MQLQKLFRYNYIFIFTSVLLLSSCASINNKASVQAQQTDSVKINPLRKPVTDQEDPIYQLMVAELAVNKGQTSLAVKNYLSLALSQDNPKIAERAVRIAVFGKDMTAAQQAAERWISLEPENVDAQQVMAAISIRQKDADKAYQFLSQLINSQPEITDDIFISILRFLSREKNSSTLLQVSKKIADTHHSFAYAHFLHGSLAARFSKTKESLTYLDKALAIKEIPDAYSLRAKMLIKLGKRNEAVISLKRAVLSQPTNRQLRMAYARLLVDVKEYEKARVEFEKLHQQAPNDANMLYTLGLLSLESQRFDAAEKYLTKLLKTGKRKGEAQYYLGRIFQSRNKYQQAIDWYLSVNSGEYRFDAQLRASSLIADSGKIDEAITLLKTLSESSQSKSSLVRIYITQGDIFQRAGKPLKAIEVFTRGLEVIPGNSDLLYSRGLTGESVGNIEMLETDMLTILETEPDNANALNALGFTLADETDRLEEAYKYLRRAIELKPEEPAIIDSFGWVHYRLGNYDKAINYLKKALSQIQDSEIAAHLGEVLWVSGKKKEAMQVWQKALKESPNDPFLLKTIQQFNP